MAADAQTQGQTKKEGRGRGLLLLLLLLLLIGGGFAWWWFNQKNDGSFELTFRACDSQDRCANFKLFAPGYDYRWEIGLISLEELIGEEGAARDPNLAEAIETDLRDFDAVIAAGLASREGGQFYNRRLAACRSMQLAELVEDAAQTLDLDVDLYRVSLGRYQPSGGQVVVEGEDTGIERLVVLAFVSDMDPGIDLGEALKMGLEENLEPALAQTLPAIREQLTFSRYDCWRSPDDYAVTPDQQLRQACYREASRDISQLCLGFY